MGVIVFAESVDLTLLCLRRNQVSSSLRNAPTDPMKILLKPKPSSDSGPGILSASFLLLSSSQVSSGAVWLTSMDEGWYSSSACWEVLSVGVQTWIPGLSVTDEKAVANSRHRFRDLEIGEQYSQISCIATN